jgi:acylphosphatase
MEIMENLEIIASGRVQGVGYRFFVSRMANIHKITGYVRNMENGNVKIIACSESENMIIFLAELRKGPSFAEVLDLKISEITSIKTYGTFTIEY